MAHCPRGRGSARLAAALSLLVARTAEACPLCNSETGAAVRASLFGEHFVTTLLAVLSPFPVIVVAVLLLRFGWPRVPQRRGRDGT